MVDVLTHIQRQIDEGRECHPPAMSRGPVEEAVREIRSQKAVTPAPKARKAG